MKKIFYKILKSFFNFKNKQNRETFENFCTEFNFLDIGAAEGLDKRWSILKKKLIFFLLNLIQNPLRIYGLKIKI